jgi:hypothetical protein
MRPGPRGNPEHSARAVHAPTWAHAIDALQIRTRVDEIEAGTAELEHWKTVRARLEAASGT